MKKFPMFYNMLCHFDVAGILMPHSGRRQLVN